MVTWASITIIPPAAGDVYASHSAPSRRSLLLASFNREGVVAPNLFHGRVSYWCRCNVSCRLHYSYREVPLDSLVLR